MDSGFNAVWQGDGVIRSVAALLLLMSVSAWVLIFWKAWVLTRVRRDLARSIPAFWAAQDLDMARTHLKVLDRERVVLPLLDAGTLSAPPDTLEATGHLESQLTRRLRDALLGVVRQLQFGQVLLASVGSTAPFIGLFGTVWGIYHALQGIATAGSFGIDKVAGPVGEALIMTAAGLAVAIPAVLAYNVFGKWVGVCEATLEGYAHDLREMLSQRRST
jgi:biopolymer transport protein ExbB